MTTGAYCSTCFDSDFRCAKCMSAREQYLALVYNGPLMTADAIVVLAGEDAKPRADVAAGLFLREAAKEMLVTGLPETLEHRESAADVSVRILAHGCAPDRITVDNRSENTRQQAERVVAEAKGRGWRRILLVASIYHIPRALLTFVQAMADAGLDTLHIVPVPAYAASVGVPEHMRDDRMALLAREMEKCDEYAAKGDCASYEAGIAYLRQWEGK